MIRSESINELASALAKAQAEMKSAAKDGTNPHFRSQYSTLESVWSAARDPLSKNGLAVSQGVESNSLTTLLFHSSGQWIQSSTPIIMVKQDMQGLGSAITYARRYALAAIVGIVSDDDDDGNAAVAPPKEINRTSVEAPKTLAQAKVLPTQQKPVQATPNVPKPGSVTEPQLKRLYAIALKQGWTNDTIHQWIKDMYQLDSLSQLSRQQYDELCNVTFAKPPVVKTPLPLETDFAFTQTDDVPF